MLVSASGFGRETGAGRSALSSSFAAWLCSAADWSAPEAWCRTTPKVKVAIVVANNRTVAILTLLRNMVLLAPCARAATFAEMTPATGSLPAANQSAALSVEAASVAGIRADAELVEATAANRPADNSRLRRRRRARRRSRPRCRRPFTVHRLQPSRRAA